MRKSMRWTLALTLVAALTVCGVREVRAQVGHGGGPLRHLAMQILPVVRQAHSDMNLTAEQHQQIRAILASRWPEIQASLKAVKAAHKRVLDLSVADKVDEAAIRQAVAAGTEAVADAAVLRANVMHQILPLLTPAQRERAAATRSQISGIIDNAIEHGPHGVN